MRLAAVVVLALMAALTPLQAAAGQKPDASNSNVYFQKILTNPAGGDEVLVNRVFRKDAQGLSNRMFGALAKVLGGAAPTLAFPTSLASDEFHASAAPATNTVNLDPTATQALVQEASPFHSSFVNALPHEMAHLRQTPQVLASLPDREGGAQAFADMVSSVAAAMAKTPYDGGAYDGSYAPFVQAAKARGNDWITGTQFGHAPVSWP